MAGLASCTPYRGGIDLYRPNGSCTSAYNAKKTGVNNYYLLTAGHCGLVNLAWFHDEIQVGLMQIRAYVNQGAADAGGIGRPGTSGHKNWIFVTAGEPARPITSRQGHDADNAGESVCISGKVIGFWCGTILSDNVDNVFTGTIILNNLRSATYQSRSTDSGSPIFYGNVAKGIHLGQIGATRYYTHIWEDEQALRVAVLTAPT